jgi:hypothetical protein
MSLHTLTAAYTDSSCSWTSRGSLHACSTCLTTRISRTWLLFTTNFQVVRKTMLRAFFLTPTTERRAPKVGFFQCNFPNRGSAKDRSWRRNEEIVNRATYVPDPKINRTASAPTRESPRSGRIPTYHRRYCIVETIASERQKCICSKCICGRMSGGKRQCRNPAPPWRVRTVPFSTQYGAFSKSNRLFFAEYYPWSGRSDRQ